MASRMAASMSSRTGGRAAKKPKRVGSASRIAAADSLTSRARWMAGGPERRVHPGAVRERMVVPMSWFSMTDLVASRSHEGRTHPEGSWSPASLYAL